MLSLVPVGVTFQLTRAVANRKFSSLDNSDSYVARFELLILGRAKRAARVFFSWFSKERRLLILDRIRG